ncbi:vitamin K epoxide reductase complex subunit 1-like protein 1 [Centruroides vittatus]|uniref:vitamin K epoxide reductase complex subunit 1-like protein 1 n=1 Tax=Centruroides vittatus TaxID=120091 RepID=UPI003510459E
MDDDRVMYYRMLSITVCLIGLVLSFYAYHVETKKEKDKKYRAMCDISGHMSCSAVFNSRYGKGFGIMGSLFGEKSILNQPNSIYGIIFYTLQLILGEINQPYAARLYLGFAIISIVGSVYLAYILAFILHDFCVVCVATYVLNAALLFCSLHKFWHLEGKFKAE